MVGWRVWGEDGSGMKGISGGKRRTTIILPTININLNNEYVFKYGT